MKNIVLRAALTFLVAFAIEVVVVVGIKAIAEGQKTLATMLAGAPALLSHCTTAWWTDEKSGWRRWVLTIAWVAGCMVGTALALTLLWPMLAAVWP